MRLSRLSPAKLLSRPVDFATTAQQQPPVPQHVMRHMSSDGDSRYRV